MRRYNEIKRDLEGRNCVRIYSRSGYGWGKGPNNFQTDCALNIFRKEKGTTVEKSDVYGNTIVWRICSKK